LGSAAKTIFEIKGLDYVAAPWSGGEPNADIVAWCGEASAPIVAWAKEKPINRWIDILYLAERLAPKPSLIPTDATQRALMIGLSHEICGEMGIGWNRRLQLFAPAYASGSPPPNVSLMGSKYGYHESDANAAGERIAGSLKALTMQRRNQFSHASITCLRLSPRLFGPGPIAPCSLVASTKSSREAISPSHLPVISSLPPLE
jgi:hypothetical protein